MAKDITGRPVPLPLDVEGLTKRLQEKKTVVRDNVMALLTALYRDDPTFQPLLDAARNEDALNGSVNADRFVVSQKILERAKAEMNPFVKNLNLEQVMRLVESCMVLLGFGRKQRRKGELMQEHSEAAE